MNWTEQQKQAIEARDVSVAVSAAAGSGKTSTLTQRIIERVCAADGSGDISRILAVTYTKAAAAEIISRLEKALTKKLAENPANKHIARQSLLVSSARVSTIHSFCLSV
ncbi:MAG: UvrD-helicase domain-containing protein, partial [Clostridia bacterium]|nr:UvrD-helicase domain-containing protein [Clostridia bacterium]